MGFSIRWYAVVVSRLLLAALMVGCGEDFAAPSFPSIAGQYPSELTVSFVNSIENFSVTEASTIAIGPPDRRGNFEGSYQIDGATGTIAGTVRTDGRIAISRFGDAASAPGSNVQYLRVIFDWCDWDALQSSAMSGTISGRTVTFSGEVTLPCRYINPTTTVATTITTTFVGTR